MIKRYSDIINAYRGELSDKDEEKLKTAYIFAANRHQGQVRLSGEPYFNHPISVAIILAEMGADVDTLIGGLLHDVIEDTVRTPKETVELQEKIRKLFGEDVLNMVMGVTKVDRVSLKLSREEASELNLKNFIEKVVDDPRVVLIKLADRLHNMRTLHFIKDEEKRKRISKETLEIYARIAHIFGMGKIKGELEDLSFKYLYPTEYEFIEKTLLQHKNELEQKLVYVKKQLEKLLENENIKFEITYRIKRPYSIYQKLKRKKVSIKSIYDLLALRIIVEEDKDCFKVEELIRKEWTYLGYRYRNFIERPKPNKYQALHYTIVEMKRPFEVQIRSKRMHDIAERGVASHFFYKNGEREISSYVGMILEDLKGSLKYLQKGKYLKEIPKKLKEERINVMTPQRDFVSLPKGSTVIDFAYLIHTEIGNHFKSAIVNGEKVNANYVLKNWDIVEIITDSSSVPNYKWLYFVKTHKAKAEIKNYFNKKREERRAREGKNMLIVFLKSADIEPDEFIKNIESSSEFRAKYGNLKKLFLEIQSGKITLNERFIKEFYPEFKGEVKAFEVKKKTSKNEYVFPNDGDVLKLGKCCNPIYGEKIFGYRKNSSTITVHTYSCRWLSMREILDPQKIVNVKWAKNIKMEFYPSLLIIGDDINSLMFSITKFLKKKKIKLKGIKVTEEGGKFEIKLKISVNHISQLNSLVNHLKSLKEVSVVKRLS